MQQAPFIPIHNSYKQLKVYQKAECIYDVTYYFAHKYYVRGDRTIDQMVQAARSGKQNIAEGINDNDTSREMGIKLVNVAKGSLEELKNDYEDYLRVHGQQPWPIGSENFEKTRRACYRHNDTAYYNKAIPLRSPETIANISIVMIMQTNNMLDGLLKWMINNFQQKGGIKEEMYKARMDWRSHNPNNNQR